MYVRHGVVAIDPTFRIEQVVDHAGNRPSSGSYMWYSRVDPSTLVWGFGDTVQSNYIKDGDKGRWQRVHLTGCTCSHPTHCMYFGAFTCLQLAVPNGSWVHTLIGGHWVAIYKSPNAYDLRRDRLEWFPGLAGTSLGIPIRREAGMYLRFRLPSESTLLGVLTNPDKHPPPPNLIPECGSWNPKSFPFLSGAWQ